MSQVPYLLEQSHHCFLSFITLLIRLLVTASSTFNSEGAFSRFAGKVTTDIIAPNLVWRAGRYEFELTFDTLECEMCLAVHP